MAIKDPIVFKQNIADKIKCKALILPTAPKIALSVQNALKQDPDIDAHKIANLIVQDSALAAAVIKSANAVGSGGFSKAKTLPQAVAKIGLNRIRSLVFTITMEQMFITNSKFAKQRLDQIWQQSLDVAAKSIALIATHNDREVVRHLDPDVMTLVGISHHIGLLPIYVELASGKFDTNDKQFIVNCERSIGPALTKMILKDWGMDIEIVQGASGWQNTKALNNPLTYADMVKLISINSGHFPAPEKTRIAILNEAKASGILSEDDVFTRTQFTEKATQVASMLS